MHDFVTDFKREVGLEKMSNVKETLMCWIQNEVSKGCDGENCFDVMAAGQVVDMIKDLAEASEKCVKKEYYEYLLCKMKEEEKMPARYGYDNWRYASSGQFAPKGRGSYDPVVGYTPMSEHGKEIYDPTPEFWNDIRMGYREGNGRNRGNSSDSQNAGQRSNERSGYWYDERIHSGRGDSYDKYQDAKRHYTETGKMEDKKKMEEHLGNHFSDLIMQVREMSEDASPEMRKKLKMGVNGVLDDMNKMV